MREYTLFVCKGCPPWKRINERVVERTSYAVCCPSYGNECNGKASLCRPWKIVIGDAKDAELIMRGLVRRVHRSVASFFGYAGKADLILNGVKSERTTKKLAQSIGKLKKSIYSWLIFDTNS